MEDEIINGKTAEEWGDYKEERRQKRWDNNENSLKILEGRGIDYKILNASQGHYRVGDYDFWATTGKYYCQKTGDKGRGVFNLIKKLK